MNLLLDTHIFIWWDSDPDQLTPQARQLCEDAGNTLYLSLASVWEMQIKSQLGKLTFHRPLAELVASQQQANGLQILPITLAQIYAVGTLPPHHKDPFDRLLMAQSIVEGLTIVSMDAMFLQYPVKVLG